MREFSGKDVTISQSVKAVLASINWAIALSLVVVGSYRPLPNVALAWALICALWGATFVGWALLVRERLALERLAAIMADEMARHAPPGERLQSVR
jgi:RsiW-degrading membrane proteinase PrsW (M82 family)